MKTFERFAVLALLAGGCLSCGPDTNIKWRTLYTAVQKGDAEDVRRHLLRGDKVDEINETYGWTPLHKASSQGHVEIVALLLEFGARTDIRDRFGKVPLDYATEQGFDSIVALLADETESKEES